MAPEGPADGTEGGPPGRASGAGPRADQDSVLPQIQRDTAALRHDVQAMRRDLQQLLAGRAPADAGGTAPSGTLCAPDAAGRGGGGDPPAHPGADLPRRAPSPTWQQSARDASGYRVLVAGAAAAQRAPEEQRPLPPHRVAGGDDEDPGPGRPPAPANPCPATPADPPRGGSAFIAPAAQRGSESERGSEKGVSWQQDALPVRVASGASSGGSLASKQGASTRDLNQLGSPTNLTVPSSATASFLNFRDAGKSLAKSRLTLSLARASRGARKTPLLEWMRSLARPQTYRGLTAAGVLQSPRFDNIISLLILGNALAIGLEADHAARNVTDATPWPYRGFDVLFCVLFTLELLLRVWVHKVGFFFSRGYSVLWNYFDLLVVGAQLVQEGFELIRSSTSDGSDAGKLQVLRILRVLRIVRIFRLVRVLHLISELRTIVSSIMGSFRSLFWTVVLLLLMMYVVGVWFLQTVTDHFVTRSDFDGDGGRIAYSSGEDKLREHFDSLAQTILSLWQALSGGVDWSEVANPLISEVQPLLGVAFAAFIAFALLALMNVVTGVFVQNAVHSAEREEEEFLTDQIIQLFHKKGDDDWGRITDQDLDQLLDDPDVAKRMRSIKFSAEDAKYVFALLDVEEIGEVQFEEFLSACLRLKGTAKSLDMLIQLQESRHSKRVLEDMLAGLEDHVARISDLLQGKLGGARQGGAPDAPRQPDTRVEVVDL